MVGVAMASLVVTAARAPSELRLSQRRCGSGRTASIAEASDFRGMCGPRCLQVDEKAGGTQDNRQDSESLRMRKARRRCPPRRSRSFPRRSICGLDSANTYPLPSSPGARKNVRRNLRSPEYFVAAEAPPQEFAVSGLLIRIRGLPHSGQAPRRLFSTIGHQASPRTLLVSASIGHRLKVYAAHINNAKEWRDSGTPKRRELP